MFDWKWYLSDIKQDKPVNVFSTFSSGGGSSMGYKRAGFHVLGGVEIDERINKLYVNNLHPELNYCMDLRDFNKIDTLPEELYNLDILDGSPPCSTFSMAGIRERAWGKEKAFAEGQKKQRLDDLFFVFLDTVEKLMPRVVVAENVPGLLAGNAKGYVNAIIKRFKSLGYSVQLFKLNAAKMDVPQNRERVFFIANRMGYKPLKLSFNGKPILFKDVRAEHGKPSEAIGVQLMKHAKKTDFCIADINNRLYGKNSGYTQTIFHDERVAPTITSSSLQYRFCDGLVISETDCRHVGTFPQDYDFGDRRPSYVVGMSVPPNMTANIATQIYKQWLIKE